MTVKSINPYNEVNELISTGRWVIWTQKGTNQTKLELEDIFGGKNYRPRAFFYVFRDKNKTKKSVMSKSLTYEMHDDVIKWKHFPRYWQFVRGIHRSTVNSPHKGQWRGALVFSLICVWINDWVNNREAGDLSRHRGHYDVIAMVVFN